jgi:predicted Rossmann fold nucleotide-binding protein DprA/Smf involved in DNA uptake
MTFATGFKNYYKQIIEGDVLVCSTFFPKSPWKAELAMARNPIIYGLADEIFVAESSEKGGTWSGVTDGLRKGRKIFVRKPELNEKNANKILIEKGAIPVDLNGFELPLDYELKNTSLFFEVREPADYASVESKIQSALMEKSLTVKELIEKLKLQWSPQKLSSYLKKLDYIEVSKKKNSNTYKLKNSTIVPKQNFLF